MISHIEMEKLMILVYNSMMENKCQFSKTVFASQKPLNGHYSRPISLANAIEASAAFLSV